MEISQISFAPQIRANKQKSQIAQARLLDNEIPDSFVQNNKSLSFGNGWKSLQSKLEKIRSAKSALEIKEKNVEAELEKSIDEALQPEIKSAALQYLENTLQKSKDLIKELFDLMRNSKTNIDSSGKFIIREMYHDGDIDGPIKGVPGFNYFSIKNLSHGRKLVSFLGDDHMDTNYVINKTGIHFSSASYNDVFEPKDKGLPKFELYAVENPSISTGTGIKFNVAAYYKIDGSDDVHHKQLDLGVKIADGKIVKGDDLNLGMLDLMTHVFPINFMKSQR